MSRTTRKKFDDERHRAWRVVYGRDYMEHKDVPIPGWDTTDRPPLSERTKRRDGRKGRTYRCHCTWCINRKEVWKNRKAEKIDLSNLED